MAYAAVHSLEDTIKCLLYSSRISFASSTRETLQSALDHARVLQHALEYCSEGVGDMDEQIIIEEARKLEDAVEFSLLSQSPTFSFNLDDDVDCFVKTAKERKQIIEEQKAAKMTEEEDVEESFVEEEDVEMIGLCDQFLQIRDYLLHEGVIDVGKRVIWISGMAGIGKTALAKKIFDDPLVKKNFHCRAFVRVGLIKSGSAADRISQAITDQLKLENEGMSQKSLIVLDDVWDQSLDFARFDRTGLKDERGNVILVTSRMDNIYLFFNLNLKLRFMNKKESWELLRRKVFGREEECPSQLVKAGKKIAKKCEGLPLLICAVAPILLSRAQKIPEYWNRVAEKPDSVLEEASHQISQVLLKSYNQISEDTKLQFLYIASFPLNCIVPRSTIINLWFAEGFPSSLAYRELICRNLVIDHQKNWSEIKAFTLHCVYWYVSKRVARNNKFLYIINTWEDDLEESVKSHRRLAIQRNVLFAIKEVHNKIAYVATMRSLLCTRPYNQYQVPICWKWKLLRVLHALTIRFYEFPIEVAKLIRLRYLALTCNANLPPSISKLWNLEFLIVHQHMNIKRIAAELYLPEEIWDLQELLHLEIMGRNLPDPRPGAVLPNLNRLLGVGVESCTKRVLESIPSLSELRIQIELTPNATQTLSCFDHISSLEELKSFQCVIMNPTLSCPPPSLSVFASGIKKLSLSGFGYPWEDMSKIVELQNLEELKLLCYAFRGQKWEAKEMRFRNLRHLLIDGTDLVQWTAAYETFQHLRRLTMKNCYKLQKTPSQISGLIELVDCNPLVETWARTHYFDFAISVKYSWKEKVKSR